METKKVLFLTTDHEYVRRVKAYMAKHHSDLVILHIADVSELTCALSACRVCALIVGMEFGGTGIASKSDLPVAYLSENAAYAEHNGHPVFCKYRSANAIYAFITGVCAAPQKTPDICAFFSVDASGSSTAAAAYTRYLAMSKKSVLFICLDRYASISRLFESRCGVVTELALALKQNSNELSKLCLSKTGRDSLTGAFYIDCCNEACEYSHFNLTALKQVVGALISTQPYDAVVFDGSVCDPMYRNIAERYADIMCVVTGKDGNALNKTAPVLKDLITSRKKYGLQCTSENDLALAVIENHCSEKADISGTENVDFVGCIPHISDKTASELVTAMAQLPIWQQLESAVRDR